MPIARCSATATAVVCGRGLQGCGLLEALPGLEHFALKCQTAKVLHDDAFIGFTGHWQRTTMPGYSSTCRPGALPVGKVPACVCARLRILGLSLRSECLPHAQQHKHSIGEPVLPTCCVCSAGHVAQQLRSLKPQDDLHSDRLIEASQHTRKPLRSPAAIFKALPMTTHAQKSTVAVLAVTVVAAATYAGYKYGYKGDALPTLPSVVSSPSTARPLLGGPCGTELPRQRPGSAGVAQGGKSGMLESPPAPAPAKQPCTPPAAMERRRTLHAPPPPV